MCIGICAPVNIALKPLLRIALTSLDCLCVCMMMHCILQPEQMTDFKREMQDISLKKK
jgi:hypothetical protein